ncbi:hypothetical protein DL96DRAFT_41881 [Flagelloscypha sp. PMI_526]|nr:hypothetical protein DL96DRAFT_41881 [Flagelloscypha sp. PMI_526]
MTLFGSGRLRQLFSSVLSRRSSPRHSLTRTSSSYYPVGDYSKSSHFGSSTHTHSFVLLSYASLYPHPPPSSYIAFIVITSSKISLVVRKCFITIYFIVHFIVLLRTVCLSFLLPLGLVAKYTPGIPRFALLQNFPLALYKPSVATPRRYLQFPPSVPQ